MRKPLTPAELKAMAARLHIPLQDVARWHRVEAPRYISINPGRPKGKVKRPKGTLSIRDAMDKFGVTAAALRMWREQGLPYQNVGMMIVMKETDLKKWVEKRTDRKLTLSVRRNPQ